MTAHDHAGPAISVTGLRKSFGGMTVLDGIDLAVPEGAIFALPGPNGAGKTTVAQTLSTPNRLSPASPPPTVPPPPPPHRAAASAAAVPRPGKQLTLVLL